MKLNRREFVKVVAGAAVSGVFGGCASAIGAGGRVKPPREMWALMANLGAKMWEENVNNDHVDLDMAVWRTMTDRMAEKKLNVLLIDLGEGLRYPSHPELAVRGAWEPEQMQAEIAHLKRQGILAVPKLNFSSTHDQWLGKWRNYLSTPEYYRVCADVIRDVAEIFDESPLFHLGWDEEAAHCQPRASLIRLRQGDLWWNDFLFTVGEVERAGMRAWIWSDYYWHHPKEFVARMPKRVLQSNWYYGRNLDYDYLVKRDREKGPNWGGSRVREVAAWEELDKLGYDQVPTGSTWSMDGFQTKNFPEVVKRGRKVVAPGRLKGFLMAPWLSQTIEKNRDELLRSIDNVAEARGC